MFSLAINRVIRPCLVLVATSIVISVVFGQSERPCVFEASVVVVQSKERDDVEGSIDMTKAGWLVRDFMAVRVERVISGPELPGIIVLNVYMDDDSRKGLKRLDQGVTALDPSYWRPGMRLAVTRGFLENLGPFEDYFTRYPCPNIREDHPDEGGSFLCERLDLKSALWPYCYCVSVDVNLSDIHVLGLEAEAPPDSMQGE